MFPPDLVEQATQSATASPRASRSAVSKWLIAEHELAQFGRMLPLADLGHDVGLEPHRGDLGVNQGAEAESPSAGTEGATMARRRQFRRTPWRMHRLRDRLAGEAEGAVVGHGLEVGRQLGRRGVAVAGLGGQAAAAPPPPRAGGTSGMGRLAPGARAAAPGPRRAEARPSVIDRDLEGRANDRSPLTRQSEQDNTEGIEIGAGCRPRFEPALGELLQVLERHVGEGPADRRRARPPRGSIRGSCSRRLKVEQHRQAIADAGHEDVPRSLTSRCKTWRSWACCSASAIRAPHQAIAWA